MENLFVYGKNRDKEFKKIIGREIHTENCILVGYKVSKVMIGEKVYFDLIRDENSKAFGVLFKLDLEDLRKLDNEEENYRRIHVTLSNGQTAYAYIKD